MAALVGSGMVERSRASTTNTREGCPRFSHRVTILWNANNTFGFDRIDWERLSRAAVITTGAAT
jgi:hypothetical protein